MSKLLTRLAWWRTRPTRYDAQLIEVGPPYNRAMPLEELLAELEEAQTRLDRYRADLAKPARVSRAAP